LTSSTPQDNPEDQEANDLEVGDQVFPLGSLNDLNERGHELELGDWGPDLNLPVDLDDAEGPNASATEDLALVPPIELGEDEPLEDSSSFDTLIDLQTPELSMLPDEDFDGEADEETYVSASDAEFFWSPQPWCEHRLARAFVPHVGLAGVGNFILATGDSTEVLTADGLDVLETAPTSDTTSTAVALDDSATRSLLTTATGQLLLWDRHRHSVHFQMTGVLKNVDRTTCICQGSTGTHGVWLLGDGSIFFRDPGLDSFRRVQTSNDFLWIASTDTGVLGLTRDYHLMSMSAQSDACTDRIRLPCLTNGSALAKSPILAAARDAILVGAREYGAWLSTDGGRYFQEIAGCRNLTAATFGVCSGRVCLWLALFYELEDRTDLVVVDCKSRRVSKLAKFSVFSDCPGPDDDPPERARVDSLHWDCARQRLWAAGCFGVTCFEPPQSMQPPS
jgi:hypothetical protein